MIARARCVDERGEEGGVPFVANALAQMCARNYSGVKFIVPIQVPVLSLIMSPVLAGD